MFRLYLSLLLIALGSTVYAQTPYGNDWINFSQPYYKIKVAKNGIYRIKQSDLAGQNVNLSGINPKNFQVFHKGKEVAVFVNGEQDNSFDASDYIEFYGEKNDGTLDNPMYLTSSQQPHQHYSLFTDTSAYFLTWSTTAGKRMQNFSASAAGATAQSFIIAESLGVYPEGYYPGRYVIAAMSFSDYQEGEGFLGATYSKGTTQTRTLATPKLFTGAGATAINLQTYVAGRSNANSTNPQGYNHHLRISVSNGAVTTQKKDTLFFGYAVSRPSFTIAPSEFGASMQILYSSIDDLGAVTDLQAVGYAKITYPKTLDVASEGSFAFKTFGTANGTNTSLQFSNNAFANPVIWDFTTSTRVTGSGANPSFVLSGNANNRSAYFTDANTFNDVSLSKIEFTNFAPTTSNKDFLIITHQSLLTSAQDYATYRTQTGYRPLVVTIDQLYDQFFYGVHHPLAIRNFANYLLTFASTKPQYLLLLGKGYENYLSRSLINQDLVPTYGSPPSDDLFTARLQGGRLEPAIATGRVVAKNNVEVTDYLNKLKVYEQLPDSLWRKNFIHISGGNNLSENVSWAGYQNNFLNQASAEFFGAKSVNFQKFVNQPIVENQKQKIIAEINKGSQLLSFFGHGAHQATEVDFGNPNELGNDTKPLVYLANGCTTGNPFLVEPSLSEKHIIYPSKGAIGWIGTSSEGVASYLGNFSTIFYRQAFNQQYGKSIAQAMKEAKKLYQNPNDELNVMHTTQYTWQGDPAVKFFSPQKPDYEINDRSLYIYPERVTAVSDSFAVAIVVKNIGKALSQPLKVSVTRTLPDNSVVTYPIQTFTKSVYNTDTLYFYIKSNDVKTAGINRFSVSIDPQNQYDELSETNNIASFQYNMVVNGVNLIYPKRYAIVPTTSPELVVQSNNLTIGNAEYVFEIDTVATFDSNWKKTSSIVPAGFMAKWTPSLLHDNNKVYYWRAKLNLAIDKGGAWQEGSFTYVKNSPDGWNQAQFAQLGSMGLFNIEANNSTKKFEFKKSIFQTSVQTRGDDAPTTDERTYRANPGGRLGFIGYEFEGFTILALRPNTFVPFSYPSPHNIINNDGLGAPDYYSGQFYFNINNPVAVDSLVRYIGNIPNGYYVIGFNGRNINLSNLSASAKTAFASLGVSNIGSIKAGEPYAFWGQKGTLPGTAIEKFADPTSATPARSQQFKFDKEYPFPFNEGTYTSEPAGIATKWKKAYYNLATEAGEQVTFDLIGYNQNGATQVLQTNLPSDSLDLSFVDAKINPKLAIKANIIDNTNRTPPQVIKWRFLYDELPENTINPELKNDFYKTSIQEGDSVKWNLAWQNISKYPSDSVKIVYTLTKADRSVQQVNVGKIASLEAGKSTTFNIKLPTMGLAGANQLKVDLIPFNNLDSYSFNNYLQQPFTVIKDNQHPVVDVAFDGKHIINGEIVAPQPNIFVNLTDENSFILLNDTTVLDIYLKTANGADKRIAYSSGLLNFSPASSANNNKASVMYKPNKLADGIYTLTVKSKDKTGNISSANDFIISFEVINESAITHFYPYPNPFTTSMKFVFTLTGNKIPDKIKVQIMTITGKIVREVFKEELGNIRIGNNISDFSWDGTDQFGDRLANGVYFYQVIVENNDQSEIKHRATKTDSFFKKNTGKIYLMR